MQNWFIKNGLFYIDGTFQKKNMMVQDGKIKEISSENNRNHFLEYDAKGRKIVPGFIDIHTHGAVGVDINSATADDLEKISHFFALQGTTSFLCSILTDTKEQTLWCIDQFNQYKKRTNKGAKLLGIHLEGPFLAAEYKGAMPEHLLKKPDFDLLKEYQEKAEGNICYITVSPEIEGMKEYIKEIQKLGIVVAMGHSGADYKTSIACIKNGAKSATHTFNAMKLLHQHFPAILGAVLETDIYCEAILDGKHLHPGIVRLLIKTKGIDKVVAITDSIMATGLSDGNYKLGVNDIVVIEGDAKLKESGVRAGSTLTTKKALQNALQFTERPLEEVIKLFTENPAKLLGIFDKKGSFGIGKEADFVVLEEENQVIDTFVEGKKIDKNEKGELS